MTDYFYDLMLRQMAREQQEWDRQMEHQGWFRRPPTVPVLTRCRMTIGGLLISLGTRLQQPTHGPLPTQSGNASDARSS